MSVKIQYIYHTSEHYFLRTLISQVGVDQPSTIHLRAAEEKQNGFCRYIATNKVILWSACYSACVVYTKTIILLSVGESGGYLPPLRQIIVKCSEFKVSKYITEMHCVVNVTSINGTGLAREKAKSCQGSPLCGIDKHVRP